MNKDKIIKLLEDGAYLDSAASKFYHPSFRKGWRKITLSNISMWAALAALRGVVTSEESVWKIRVA